MEIICFHNPDEENGYLSNWYESKFIIDHVKFSCMEQFMMYQKAITFQDQTIAKEILQTRDSAKIKQMPFGGKAAREDHHPEMDRPLSARNGGVGRAAPHGIPAVLPHAHQHQRLERA